MPEPRRADARDNRQRLIGAARAAFASSEQPSLEGIARDAGVGIGTLYRHFPRREALVEAVYRDQLADLRTGAEKLLKRHPPARALRLWMDLFAGWADAKRGMVQALAAMRSDGTLDIAASRGEIEAIIAELLDAGIRDGTIRDDADAADVRTLLAGIMAAAGGTPQAARLFDLALRGLERC